MSEDELPTRLGRFEIQGLVGEGGMGTVLRGFDPQLERAVAIKILSEQLGEPVEEGCTIDLRASGGAAEQLFVEARALAQIADPNVLAVHEIGTDRGRTFLVMELVDGIDLRAWLAQAPRSAGEILEAFIQAGRGLGAAHRSGVIHRDFKPANLLVSRDGRVRVADFGIASLAQRSLVRVSDHGAGTPKYMAPELWRDEPATMQSDIYAFAMALAEALLGALPEDRAPAIVVRELAKHGVSERVRAVIARGLDPEPANRPRSIDDVIGELAEAPRTWVRWAVAATAALAVGIGVTTAIVLTRGTTGAVLECSAPQSLLAGRWSGPERAAVTAAVGALDPKAATTITETLDQYATSWTELRTATCATELAPKLRAARLACFDRRLFELGAVARTLRAPLNREQAISRSKSLPDLGSCLEMLEVRIPDSPVARAKIETLTAELVAIQDRALVKHTELADQPALEALARDAEDVGDHELAIRAHRIRGQLLGNVSQVAEAAKAYDVAYELASRHHLDALAGSVLVDSARIFTLRGDYGGAESQLRIARGLLERAPDATPVLRVRMYRGLGDLGLRRGDLEAARQAFDQAQLAADRIDPRDPMISGRVLVDRAKLEDAAGKPAEAMELARKGEAELVGLGKLGVPDRAAAMSAMVDIDRHRGDLAAAHRTNAARVALLETTLPAEHAEIVQARADIGDDLIEDGKYDEAIAVFEEALSKAKAAPSTAKLRHHYLARQAVANALLGRFERAGDLAQRAADAARTQFGERDLRIGLHMRMLAAIELEAGDVTHARTHLAVADDLLASLAADHPDRLAAIATQIDLAIDSNDPAAARAIAEKTLALLAERNVADIRKEPFWLGAARAAETQRAYQDALRFASNALASSSAPDAHRSRREIAAAEFEVAAARYGLGEVALATPSIRAAEAALRGPESRLVRRRVLAWMRAHRIAPS